MTDCMHARIEVCEQLEDDMHCAGWVCVDCGQQGVGDCHPQSWCRPNFCGAEPAGGTIPAVGAVGAVGG